MRKLLGLVVLSVALLGLPMTVSAASPWAGEATYKDQACAKLNQHRKTYGDMPSVNAWVNYCETLIHEIDKLNGRLKALKARNNEEKR